MAADLSDDADRGPERPALRRRAPLELRRVRLARADAGVRPERLRRDAARPVRVGRQAAGRELRDRGAQQRVHATADARAAAAASVTAYREAMAEFAAMRHAGRLVRATRCGRASSRDRGDASAIGEEDREADASGPRRIVEKARSQGQPAGALEARRGASTASTGSSAQPPVVVPVRGARRRHRHTRRPGRATRSTSSSGAYRATLQADRRHLLERFELVDVARKVVGVGSVGTRRLHRAAAGPRRAATRCSCRSRRRRASVLEDHLPKSRYASPGSGSCRASG